MQLPENIRLAVQKASDFRDADLLNRAYKDILVSLDGPAEERVGRDVLVLCSEAALKVGAIGIADDVLELYFLEGTKLCTDDATVGHIELKDQFVCRALYARALVHAEAAKGLKGEALIHGIDIALKGLLEGLELALADPRYLFLVYDASVHYWNISRPLQKAGTRRHLLETSSAIIQALHKVSGHEEWKAHNLRLHALCLSDNAKNDEAMKAATEAYELCKTNAPSVAPLMVKLKSYVGSLSGKKDAGGEGAEGAVSLVQYVRSGACKDTEEVKATLMDAWKKVDPAADRLGEAKEENSQGADLEVVADISWLAAQNGLLDLASWCSQRAAGALTLQPRVRSELTANLVALNALEKKKGSLIPLAIDVHKDVVHGMDQALSSLIRLHDVGGIQDACQLMWTASLPLQETDFRHFLIRPFLAATNALESVSSSLTRLRTALHLELAYCYVTQDMLAQANIQVSKGLALDYLSPDEEVQRTGYDRPLDRFFNPLARVLMLKGSLYEDPESAEDHALLLAEQARDANATQVKVDLLQRAIGKLLSLDPALPPSEAEDITDIEKETIRRAAKARASIWGTIFKVAVDAKMMSLAHQVSTHILDVKGWDLIRDKDIILLQIEVNFMDGLACIDILRSKGVTLVPPKSVDEDSTLISESVDELQSNSISAFLKAMRLGASVDESWVVMNAATHIWNNYIELIKSQRFAQLLPASVPLYEELCKLEDCDPALLGNIAHVLSSGYEHQALITAANADSSVDEERLMDYKSLRATLASQTFEGSEDIQKAIETCENVLNRVDDKNTRRLSAMLTRLQGLLGIATEVKVENDPVAQVTAMIQEIRHPSMNADSANATLSKAMSLLRPAEGHILGDLEVWARLGDAALNIKSYGAAIECCKQAVDFLTLQGQSAPLQSWYWGGVAECAYGNGIVALIRPTQQDRSAQDALNQKAFEHFVQAAKHGRRANRGDIVDYAARCFWNAATNFMTSAATRSLLTDHLEVILDACRATKVNDFNFLQSMYVLLFDCLVDVSAWADGVKHVEAAFRVLPTTEHRPLWEYKIMFLSVTGQSVSEEMNKIKEYDEKMQAKVWASLAAQASAPLEVMKAHQQAIRVLENHPLLKVDFMIDFAEWLYSSGQPAADAEDILLSALDILHDMDRTSSDGEAFAAGNTMISPRSFTSISTRSLPTSPARSTRSADSRAITAASLKANVPEPPAKFGSKQIRLFIRTFLMLSKMSGNTCERFDYLLLGHNYALRMLKDTIADAVLMADPASEVAAVHIPDTPEEWAEFKMTDELLSQIQSNTGDSQISMESIGRPELFFAYIEYLCSGLESAGMHLQCLSVCQLGVMVAKVAAKNQSLVTVYELRLATVADALFLSSAAIMHEKLAGPLELSTEELAQGRAEVKHRELLKMSSNSSRSSSQCSDAVQRVAEHSKTPKLLRPFALRDYWVARGAYLAKRGAISAATALLQEAVGHAHAHDDLEVEAWAYFHLAKCAAHGNKPIEAIKLQHRGQLLGGDVALFGEYIVDYTNYKLNTRDGQLSAKESIMRAIKLLQSRLRDCSRGSSLDLKIVLSNILIELCHVMEAEIRNVNALGGHPQAEYAQAMNAVSEAISLLQECGGGIDLVNAVMTKAMLMYKDPSAKGDPRPRLETIRGVIREAETEAERLFTAACVGTLNPLTISLPTSRMLAAVKNARASCLLEIANADKALEAYDREQNRPDFPSFQGMDASAITAFLDDSAPKVFGHRLSCVEEAVVAASEASNLHKRNDGRVDSLHLLGEALFAVYDYQTGAKVWIEPPPPPPPPAPPLPEGEENMESEQDGKNEEKSDSVGGEDAGKSTGGDVIEGTSATTSAGFSATFNKDEVMHPQLGSDIMKPRAILVLEQAIELGLKTRKYDMASRAATTLACVHGSANPVDCTAALALAQSCRVADSHLSIFMSAADSQDTETLIIKNQRASEEMLNDTSSSKYSSSLFDRLQSSCKAWRRLEIKPDRCLSRLPDLPAGLLVFSLQWLVGRGGDTSLAVASLSSNTDEVGAYMAPADAAQLAAATKLAASYRGALEKALVNESVMVGGRKPRTSVGGKPRSSVAASAPRRSSVALFGGHPIVVPDDGSPLFDSFPVKAGWNEICRAVEMLLAPILPAWASFLGSEGAKGKKIVLLVDGALSSLPIEALEVLDGADCLSRDFSLHILLQRISEASGQAEVAAGDMTYMVDLRHEDIPPPDSEDGAEATMTTIPAQFNRLKNDFGTGWTGVMGSAEGIPGEGECQRMMSGAKALLYYGHGRFLSYVAPSAVACIDLSHCQVTFLASNTISEESERKQAKLDNRKSSAQRGLEDPYETAALLSMRGVDTVVLPTFPCTSEGNSKLLRSVFNANSSVEGGADIATAVWSAGTPKPNIGTSVNDEAGEGAESSAPVEDDSPQSAPFSQWNYIVYGLPTVKLI